MKLETWQAIDLVKQGWSPTEAADETGCPRSTLYAALRKHAPLVKPRKDLRATAEDVAMWINENLEVGFSYREAAADAYINFRSYLGDGKYMSAIELNIWLRQMIDCHMLRSNGTRWLIGARIRGKV